MIYRWLPVCL